MKKENELTKRNLEVYITSITISGTLEGIDQNGKMEWYMPLPVWKIPIEYDEQVPISFVHNIGLEFIELYKKVFGKKSNPSYSANQELIYYPDEAIMTSQPSLENVLEKELSDVDEIKKRRPNYGITKQLRSFWKHQKYGQEIDIDKTYELFLTAFPELKKDLFITYLKAKSVTGQHLVVTSKTVRKVDTSPMNCL